MFHGFEEVDVATADTTIHGRRGGDGPPVLLLHGMPETHLMWHQVAPRLAEHFTVVATDLRGFGDSGAPPSTPDHAPYSMRRIAREQVEVMRLLGYEEFGAVGHDRGGRCAYRMALDDPGAVTRLAVLDIVPTGDAFSRANMDFSLGFWLWSFLAAPEPVPERLVAQAPEAIVDYMLGSLSEVPDAFPAGVRAEYIKKLSKPDAIHAICEQYRAAATLDYQHDEADRGRRRITCPVLALWSHSGPVASWYRPLEVWKAWADDVDGSPVAAGHFLPEEAPDETTRLLLPFLA
ncbi:haloacetate dehalogenase [Micromonospora rhizosphaerae]|uniref:Haloacetate dehalogenase n=1 Tax=Micromonospora rhizosphaerae TaxID=568872 RepID=A0A1C6STD9_9ACTN|nr:alpha/beta hydrolase [Micromonospora rhizosphaerae]SCL32780.1 haloacetate dehalogenase [Micromonospora rhizosphaerae]